MGRIKGVERPPLAPLIPTEKGVSLLIDCGANVDARASHLVQFAQMGSIYMEHVMGIRNPRVAIVNIGAEEEKGNALVKETFPLLKAVSYTHLDVYKRQEVGGEKDRHAFLFKMLQIPPYLPSGLYIKPGGQLVQEHHFRSGDQS